MKRIQKMHFFFSHCTLGYPLFIPLGGVRGKVWKKGKKEMRTIQIIIILLLSIPVFSQNINLLRNKGYEARIAGKTDSALAYYEKILKFDSDDYDAKLAVARLYFSIENYKKSKYFYRSILKKDKKDVEALNGLGKIYMSTDKTEKAVKYFQKAIKYLPAYVPLHFSLAKAYVWTDKLNKAIEEYDKIIDIDPTYSEAWQGKGKMNYWQEKPVSALKYYKKALELDSFSVEINNEYKQIKQETKFRISAGLKIQNENEENYQINAFIQQYGIAKRVTDHIDVSTSFLLDRSNRDFKNSDEGDTIRTFDNTLFRIGWITAKHKIYAFAGYSSSDKKLTAYGLNWRWIKPAGKITIKNSINAGYDYFYYWNKIGHKTASENFKIQYNKFTVDLNAGYGIIDSAFVEDVANDKYYTAVNPHYEYGISFSYKLFSLPVVKIAGNYSFSDYKFKSRYYYSPQGRKLVGPSVFVYYPYGNFYFYGGFSINFGTEYYYELENEELKKYYINANNWSSDLEIGYNFKSLSTSFSASRFYNDYYSNYSLLLNFKYLL